MALADLSEAIARAVNRAGSPRVAIPNRAELLAEALTAAAEALDAPDPEATIRRLLRGVKYRLVAHLVKVDHDRGLGALEDVTHALSDLADALVEGALRFARARLEAQHGCPDTEGWQDGGGFVVVAMGKHGARELNYSSDIDLVYVVADPRGTTKGPRPLETEAFATRLGRRVRAILEDRTPDGFCFRVDLNLRPEGMTGPLVIGLGAAEHYFLHYGRTWERAAWLKARPCAGDLALGDELLARIEPFRFRRLLDFGTLEDIGAMRDRIAAAAGNADRDLKRGPGGIRELEFLVQAGQLVWSGRDRRLRAPHTLENLHLLHERSALPAGTDVDALEWAYRVLRAVEHRLQWPQEAQTQRLPPEDDADAWAHLGNCYAPDAPDPSAAVRTDLKRARSIVSDAWDGMFAGDDPGDEALSMDAFASPTERRAVLQRLGFSDPDDAETRLRRLSTAGGTKRMRAETYRRFERVMPKMLALAAASAEPKRALARLEAFTARVGARGQTYTLLHESPAAAETLIRLFASSGFLAERFVAHPELLDTLLLRGQGADSPLRTTAQLLPALREQLAARDELDEAITALRTFQTAEVLRVALADMGDGIPYPGLPGPWLTAIARACVQGAIELGAQALAPRHGRLRDGDRRARFAVVGMGSLGSGWMSYGSDLDLVFVYDPGDVDASDGPRTIGHRVWATRWAQRVVTVLTVATREGRCYDVDMRLRPGGEGGPVIATTTGFRAYWRERASTWERIALGRAAVVAASDDAFANEVESEIREARRLPIDAAEVRSVAAAMRARQRDELAREGSGAWDLKIGAGSVSDLEFAAAVAQITEGIETGADPIAVLQARGDHALVDAYRALRRVEGRMRLRSTGGRPAIDWNDDEADRLALSLGLRGRRALRDVLAPHRAIASALFPASGVPSVSAR